MAFFGLSALKQKTEFDEFFKAEGEIRVRFLLTYYCTFNGGSKK